MQGARGGSGGSAGVVAALSVAGGGQGGGGRSRRRAAGHLSGHSCAYRIAWPLATHDQSRVVKWVLVIGVTTPSNRMGVHAKVLAGTDKLCGCVYRRYEARRLRYTPADDVESRPVIR